MIKIYDTSICRPLKLMFQSCLESGKFPIEWKKVNVVPVHNKGDKKILKNYRPISLLPIAGNIFKRLLYDRMFEFFIENNLISKNQSGFRAVFLDISKAFDKVWHKGFIFKLKQNGVSGKILNSITDFLSFRKQWVVLNRQAPLGLALKQVCPRAPYLDHYYF